MTYLKYIVAFVLLGQARGIVDLQCMDNATCINDMAKEFVKSLRQEKTIRLFDLITVEPIGNRQARSSQDPLTRLITTHAISFDWNDFTFRFSNPEDKSDALDLEVFENRSAKDISDEVPKKSKSKDEEEVVEDKKVKGGFIRPIKRRKTKHKMMQAVVPLLFGMKSAGVVIFALFVVSVITLKAFLASKVALLVTVGMALKRLYESYGSGVGLQNHPYLYSQYPIDFPSASSHAYSVSGVSQQFASPEMYSPSAVGSNPHSNELMSHDASAQQSQQTPTVVNSTRAAERWDGKSKLFKYLEPVVDKIRSFVDPIANVFYSMPTYRGLNSDVSTAVVEPEVEIKKRPREILIPQPRNIAQRKISYRRSPRHRPKKYIEFKVDLDKLKYNKDFLDYIKTKKYKHNYPQTYYYPRIKYFVTPNTFASKPNNNRLLPYQKPILRGNILPITNNISTTTPSDTVSVESSDWMPIIMNDANNSTKRHNKRDKKRRKKLNKKRRKRVRRSLAFSNTKDFYLQHSLNKTDERSRKVNNESNIHLNNSSNHKDKTDKITDDIIFQKIEEYLAPKKAPIYYRVTYNLVMFCLEMVDGFVEINEVIYNYFNEDVYKIKRVKKIKKRKETKRPTNPKKPKNPKKRIEQRLLTPIKELILSGLTKLKSLQSFIGFML